MTDHYFSSIIISAGLELVLSHTEKSCIASYYSHFQRFVISGRNPLGAKKTGFNLII